MDYNYKTYPGNASMTPQLDAQQPVEGSPSAIRDAVSNSEQILSEMHNTIEQLENRLDTILLPTAPGNIGASTAPPMPITSHVRGRLNILNDGYLHATARLRDLMRRVEL